MPTEPYTDSDYLRSQADWALAKPMPFETAVALLGAFRRAHAAARALDADESEAGPEYDAAMTEFHTLVGPYLADYPQELIDTFKPLDTDM